jgi:hypothetical protein
MRPNPFRSMSEFTEVVLAVLALSSTVMKAQSSTIQLRIVAVGRFSPIPGEPGGDTLQLGDRLLIRVDSLQYAIAARQVEVDKLVLFLNGYPMRGLTSTAQGSDTLVFPLERPESSRDAWAGLLGSPRTQARSIQVGLSRSDGTTIPWAGPGKNVVLRLFKPVRLVAALVLIGFIMAAIAWLFIRRRVAVESRQPFVLDADGRLAEAQPTGPPAYSLSQFQLLWWTSLIVCGFLFVWVLTRDYHSIITSQSLVLLGVSAGTAAVAKVVGDANREEALRSIDEKWGGENSLTPASPVEKVELRRLIAKTGKPGMEMGAIAELFANDSGLTLSRFQYGMWTVVLGIVWIFAVYERLSFPEFDSTLLALSGVSGGTYLGFKVGEKQFVPVRRDHRVVEKKMTF